MARPSWPRSKDLHTLLPYCAHHGGRACRGASVVERWSGCSPRTLPRQRATSLGARRASRPRVRLAPRSHQGLNGVDRAADCPSHVAHVFRGLGLQVGQLISLQIACSKTLSPSARLPCLPHRAGHQAAHLRQLPGPSELPAASQHPLSRAVNDADVSPSASGKAASPSLQPGLKRGAVPRVERRGHEALLSSANDCRVRKDAAGLLAPASAAPLHKVGEDGLARAGRLL